MKRKLQVGIVGLAVIIAGTAYAQHRHPNLMEAQRHIDAALERITAAQQANEYDMNGHAAHAKELLEQAKHEIHEAAEAADRH